MAENLNPFEDEVQPEWLDDEITTPREQDAQPVTPPETAEVTWDGIASKLLKDNFILTALELHTELVESGRELPRLRDYFSNPGNFERTKDDTPSPTLPRTSSVQTFDSLDFARYSDDGERQVDERVAVLEFELRKAQDTIKSLRATLTKEAENEIVASDGQSKDVLGEGADDGIRPVEKKALNFLVNEYLLANDYKLTSVTFAEENEDQDFEDWDDVGLNMPKPPGVVQLFRDFGTHVSPTQETQDVSCQADLEDLQHCEMIQDWENTRQQLESKVAALEDELQLIQQERDVLSQQTVQPVKENVSVTQADSQAVEEEQEGSEAVRDRDVDRPMSRLPKSEGVEVVSMLARCLPHIVPNVLLGKREELIPLILATAMLHPDSKERDRLLNILFNLIKKPDDDQRQMILTGCVVFAEHVGAERLVEELLPQCWEQISHKYVERRLLVAEACGALASYLPPEMLSSLVLSMLQQMLMDDKDDDVREAVVRSLGLLVGFIADADKYPQAFDLLQISLRDPSEKVQRTALHVFLPSFAAWAYELGRLEHQLVHAMLRDLEDIELIPFLYISVLESCPRSSIQPDDDMTVDLTVLPPASDRLSELSVLVGSEEQLQALVQHFENHIQQEWFEPWEQLNWLVNNLIPRLLEVMMGVGVSLPRVVSALCTYVHRFCRTFGKTFTQKKVKLKFEELVDLPEECLDVQVHLGHTAITTSIVPVYASGVLLSFNTEESRKEVGHFLKKVLCTLAFCQTSLDSLRATVLQLRTDAVNHDLLLSVLWDGVVHTAAVVRATAASLFELLIQGVSETLISHRVVPALVTLANDPDMSVRIATIPSLGGIIENITIREVLDRVYMQLQTFFDDPVYRDHHAVLVELIRTLARCGPNAEPKFQDECEYYVVLVV
ncbi:hypothetical protein BaRGS_00002964 [Batillaria attramentaria]|uniref:LisH domain-containing protein n=1 Tax=Batillaria attramentaria TaxID=370345 RepID=A0ABD0M2U9_9CAEN